MIEINTADSNENTKIIATNNLNTELSNLKKSCAEKRIRIENNLASIKQEGVHFTGDNVIACNALSQFVVDVKKILKQKNHTDRLNFSISTSQDPEELIYEITIVQKVDSIVANLHAMILITKHIKDLKIHYQAAEKAYHAAAIEFKSAQELIPGLAKETMENLYSAVDDEEFNRVWQKKERADDDTQNLAEKLNNLFAKRRAMKKKLNDETNKSSLAAAQKLKELRADLDHLCKHSQMQSGHGIINFFTYLGCKVQSFYLRADVALTERMWGKDSLRSSYQKSNIKLFDTRAYFAKKTLLNSDSHDQVARFRLANTAEAIREDYNNLFQRK